MGSKHIFTAKSTQPLNQELYCNLNGIFSSPNVFPDAVVQCVPKKGS